MEGGVESKGVSTVFGPTYDTRPMPGYLPPSEGPKNSTSEFVISLAVFGEGERS